MVAKDESWMMFSKFRCCRAYSRDALMLVSLGSKRSSDRLHKEKEWGSSLPEVESIPQAG